MRRSGFNLILVALLTPAVFLSACNDNPQATTGEEVAEPNINENSDEAKAFKEQDFITEAASAGLMEVQLAQVIQQKSSNPVVVEYAEMLATDHSMANDSLIKLAEENGWDLPAAPLPQHQETLNRLSEYSGKQLTRDYISAMIEGHREAISNFEDAAAFTDDDVLRRWIHQTLPHLERHLNRALEIQRNNLT